MPTTVGRLALWFPALSDNADVPEDMGLLANGIENLGVFLYDQGTLAARPVSSPASPGTEGLFYFATDIEKFYYDTGLGWIDLGGQHAGTHHPVTGTDKIPMSLSGVLADRPAATAVADGTHYFATDQYVDYVEVGNAWVRVSPPAGFGGFWFGSVAPAGYVIYNGAALPATDGIYADLYAHLGAGILPDTRGRMLVGLGTHADVSAIGASDGLATVGSRRPKHKHTITNLQTGLISTGGGTVAGGGGGTYTDQPIGGAFQVGPQTNSPTDSAAYITCAWIAKL